MEPRRKGSPTEVFYYLNSLVKHRQKPVENWQSYVLPHSNIESLAPNLWHVTGTMPNPMLPPREMAIFKLADGDLLIHSAIALDSETMTTLESLGTPKVMVVPNRIHRLDAACLRTTITNGQSVGLYRHLV
ncbi:hypothetical protein [Tolypothrix sp. VBCCA 56010]|uniref:hypothetical protein n=1 Tax=Tolypothrix sp. VBCCA 56010 TaxID=3137731 RepID=UPI003D7E9721